MDESSLAGKSLLRAYCSVEDAEEALESLEKAGFSCEILDQRLANPSTLGIAPPGVWLLVPQAHRAGAESHLSTLEAGGEGAHVGDILCTACDSSEFSAVFPGEAPRGSWYLRCLNCGRWTPVSEVTYLLEEYPLMPPACPTCGSFRVGAGEPPEFDMAPAEGKEWWWCESCQHSWAAAVPPKVPAAGGTGGPEPWLHQILEQEPAEPLEPPPDERAGEEEEEDGAGPRVSCPKCFSKPESMNDTLVAKGGPIRFLCGSCGQVWDVSLPEGTPLPQVPVVRDGDATTDASDLCPQCGSAATEDCEAPEYASESSLERFVKGLFGRGCWRRCQRCGNMWEEPT